MRSATSNLILSLVVCTIVAITYTVWYSRISEKSAEVSSLQSSIEAKSQEVSSAESARATLAKITEDEILLQNYLIKESDVVSFIGELETLGRNMNTKLEVQSVALEKKTSPYIVFVLSIKGTFDNVARAIGAIEYSPHKISVASLSISKGTEKDLWQASVMLNVGTASSSPQKTK